MGSVTAILDAIAFDAPYWLGQQVASDPELTPRLPLTAVAYSFHARNADSARVAGGAGGPGAYLPLSGGTMTGPITSTGSSMIIMGKLLSALAT